MGFIPQPKREGASRAFLPSLRLSLPMFIYEPQTREWRAGSSRVGAVFERREREQKRSGGEGGGSANILVRRIKCSVAFACSFLLRNHWWLLQHLDRRSQAEQSKIAGIELSIRTQIRCCLIAATVAILSRRLRSLPTRCRCSTTVMVRRTLEEFPTSSNQQQHTGIGKVNRSPPTHLLSVSQ